MIRPCRWAIRSAGGFAALAASAGAAAACSVTPQSVSFGNYDPLGSAALDGVGNVHVQCDVVTSFTVSLGPGGGTVANRKMTGGAELGYNLYKDSLRLIVWGEGIDGVSATSADINLPVYGRIPGGQNVPANVYGDSVTVTVSY